MLACICVGGCWRMPIESLADQREGSTIIHRFLPCMQPNSLIFCTQFSELACCTPSQDQQNLDYIKVIFGWLFFSFLFFFFFFFLSSFRESRATCTPFIHPTSCLPPPLPSMPCSFSFSKSTSITTV